MRQRYLLSHYRARYLLEESSAEAESVLHSWAWGLATAAIPAVALSLLNTRHCTLVLLYGIFTQTRLEHFLGPDQLKTT